MTKPEILNEEPVTMVEIKEELRKIKKRDTDLNFRSNKTDEYIKQFVHLSSKDAVELEKKLVGLEIPRLKDVHIKKIIDLMPKTQEELKGILSAYTVTVNNDNLKKITETVTGFTKK